MEGIDPIENRRRMLAGELYYAFVPDLTAQRMRCKDALLAYSSHSVRGDVPRRKLVELWKE